MVWLRYTRHSFCSFACPYCTTLGPFETMLMLLQTPYATKSYLKQDRRNFLRDERLRPESGRRLVEYALEFPLQDFVPLKYFLFFA